MILRKIETVTDTRYYEVELTPEQEKLWNSNQDEFWECMKMIFTATWI